jgi:hypothetical protein
MLDRRIDKVKLTPTTDQKLTICRPGCLFLAIAVSGFFSLLIPAFAVELPLIENQAIATYEDPENPADPNNPNDPRLISTTSNILRISVREVAGLSIFAKGFTDDRGNSITSIAAGDTIYSRFDLQNIGNDSTRFFIPNNSNITGGAIFQGIQFFDGTTWQNIPAAGLTSDSIPRNGLLSVRVAIAVNNGATGNITVSLGKTDLPNLQNQARNNPGDGADIYTIDNADNANPEEIEGAPVNGTREAMANQSFTVSSKSALLNGSSNNPGAVGPTGTTNDDFTLKVTPLPSGIKSGDAIDPPPTAILNTIQNSTAVTRDIKVIPQPQAGATLPDGTVVTFKKDTNDAGTSFTFINGQFVPTNPNQTTFILPSVAGNSNRNYITTIDLPTGTPAIKGFGLLLTAFFDPNGNNQPDVNEPTNKTIDWVYTGFIDTLKESRILDTKGQPLTDAKGQFSSTNKTARSGQFIEYRIKFKNIAPAPDANSGSKGMTAVNFQIIEDGNAAPNNWGNITANVPNSATGSIGSTVFSPVNDTNNLEVTKYIHTVDRLPPQAEGQFTFIRKMK